VIDDVRNWKRSLPDREAGQGKKKQHSEQLTFHGEASFGFVGGLAIEIAVS
jgi:hypothetical protein